MADHLPPALLEACVVVGASSEKLKEVYQVFASKHILTHMCFFVLSERCKLKNGSSIVIEDLITCICSSILSFWTVTPLKILDINYLLVF